MATLSNTPRQALHLTLERRKSYSFIVQVLNADSTALNLAGCSLRLTVKRSEWDTDNFDTTAMVQNKEALVTDVASGQGVFYLQAAELDWAPGEYYHTITLTTEAGFSVVIAKGLFTLLANTDSVAMQDFYTGGTATTAAEIQLRGQDTVRIVASTLTQSLMTNNIIQGTGRPDQSTTLDAATLSLVTQAAVGQFFLSKDGNYQGLWVWQLMPNKTWRVVGSDAISAPSWNNLSGKPSTFPPSEHKHPIDDVTGLQAALNALATTGSVTALGNRVSTLETAMTSKADQSSVSSLASTVSTKAEQSTVSALVSTVSAKADQSTVAAMQQELTQTISDLNSKAEQSELTILQETLLTKADQTSLDVVADDTVALDDRVTVLEIAGSSLLVTSSGITDSTPTGRALLTSASVSAARTTLGVPTFGAMGNTLAAAATAAAARTALEVPTFGAFGAQLGGAATSAAAWGLLGIANPSLIAMKSDADTLVVPTVEATSVSTEQLELREAGGTTAALTVDSEGVLQGVTLDSMDVSGRLLALDKGTATVEPTVRLRRDRTDSGNGMHEAIVYLSNSPYPEITFMLRLDGVNQDALRFNSSGLRITNTSTRYFVESSYPRATYDTGWVTSGVISGVVGMTLQKQFFRRIGNVVSFDAEFKSTIAYSIGNTGDISNSNFTFQLAPAWRPTAPSDVYQAIIGGAYGKMFAGSVNSDGTVAATAAGPNVSWVVGDTLRFGGTYFI